MGGNGDPIGAHTGMNMGGVRTTSVLPLPKFPRDPSPKPQHHKTTTNFLPDKQVNIPAGPGGGCVTTGPFANHTITLGPLISTMDPAIGIKPNPLSSGYGSNPRCLRRDVSNFFTTNFLRPQDLVSHITSNSAIGKFQDTLQAQGNGKIDLHSSGHFSIWGDPGGDVFVSPAEPVFWLHHAQLDRHWWMWANYLEAQVKTRVGMYEGKQYFVILFSPQASFFTLHSPQSTI